MPIKSNAIRHAGALILYIIFIIALLNCNIIIRVNKKTCTKAKESEVKYERCNIGKTRKHT